MTKSDHRFGLTTRILLGMFFGLTIGSIVHQFVLPQSFAYEFLVDGLFTVGGNIFVATLKMLVVPLVFVSLVCGAASLDSLKKFGRVGGKTLGLYIITTAFAVTLAIIVGTLVSPGAGFNLKSPVSFSVPPPPSLVYVITNIFPTNIVQAMADGNMLQVIVFSILFGLAIALIGGDRGKRVLGAFEDLNEIIMKIVTLLMHLAPYGVFFLMGKVFATQGLDAIAPLARYFFILLFTLILHAILTFSLLLKAGGLTPGIFFRKMRPVMLFAFSTSSSNATLPVNLETVEHRLGVKNSIASFAIPLGATINMDGTAIMQGIATVFIAEAYNIEIGMVGYLMVIITATLASIGTAGVPGVGLITLSMVLTQVGLPQEGIGLIIGVDRLLDMVRTSVNVTGDAMVSCLVAKSEGELIEETYNNPDAEVP